MSDKDEPVEVGHVWIDTSWNNKEYVITRVDRAGKMCYYKTPKGSESSFGDIDTNGLPKWSFTTWKRDRAKEAKSSTNPCNEVPLKSGERDDKLHKAVDALSFFSSVREGYCACNIPKKDCRFHKD